MANVKAIFFSVLLGITLTESFASRNILDRKCGFDDSKVMANSKMNGTLLGLLQNVMSDKTCWKKCYTASENSFNSELFHKECDEIGATVTLVRVGNWIFGGYTDAQWNGNQGYVASKKSFAFSVNNNIKMLIKDGNQEYAIFSSVSLGPRFGYGPDFYVPDACNDNYGFSNLGYSYQLPDGYTYGSTEAKSLLAGSYKFKCSEYEVYFIANK